MSESFLAVYAITGGGLSSQYFLLGDTSQAAQQVREGEKKRAGKRIRFPALRAFRLLLAYGVQPAGTLPEPLTTPVHLTMGSTVTRPGGGVRSPPATAA